MRIRSLPFLMIAASLAVTAQDPSAVLEGPVTDAAHAVVPGAMLTVTNERTGLVRKQTTTVEGAFAFPVLPVGEYALTVEKEQFAPFKQASVRLNVNQTFASTSPSKSPRQCRNCRWKPLRNWFKPVRTCSAVS